MTSRFRWVRGSAARPWVVVWVIVRWSGGVAPVETIHGLTEAVANPAGDGLDGVLERLLEPLLLFRPEAPEDVVLLRHRTGGVDAHAAARIHRRRELLLDVGESVVTAGAALASNPDDAARQGDVVDDDHQVGGRCELVETNGVGDREA